MVTIKQSRRIFDVNALDLDQWLQESGFLKSGYSFPLLRKSLELVAEKGKEEFQNLGVSYIQQGLMMAEVLGTLMQDDESLSASVLYNLHCDGLISDSVMIQELGIGVKNLIDATKQIEDFRAIQQKSSEKNQDSEQIEKLRKMLLVVVDDVRCVLVKLSEYVCILRRAKKVDEARQKELAQETIDIYAPLANRLGIGQLKWELEDLAFRYMAPGIYKNLAKQLNEKRSQREKYISQVLTLMDITLRQNGVNEVEVTGRVKHIYSIWNKMRHKNIDFDEIYDVRAVRVFVPEIKDCYAVLGLVHSLWQYIPNEFDDYIAAPKKNGYQSLHTTVIGPEGKVLEVQIRTHEMHEISELGVAAHWAYKEGKARQPEEGFESRVAWLRQLIDWQKDVNYSNDLVQEIRSEVQQEQVYVFTPKGEVKVLPTGSTPLDFAYGIHSEVGHRCKGAKVNGRMVPLNHCLKTGEQIEIIKGNEAKPSRDWLIQNNGFVHSGKARAHIHRWFKKQDYNQNLVDGKVLLEKEFKKVGLRDIDHSVLAKKFNYEDSDAFWAGLGAGDIRVNPVLNFAQTLQKDKKEKVSDKTSNFETKVKPRITDDIHVYGVDNLLTQNANCCNPVPGDAILGYVTQGRGISIHRRDCKNIKSLQVSSFERIVDVHWGEKVDIAYPVNIYIKALEREGLLKEIISAIGNEMIKLSGINLQTSKDGLEVEGEIVIEINNLNILSKILMKLSSIDGIIKASRK